MEQTPALAERSEAFLKMQEAYVRMYVNKEEIVAEQMERYKNEFFAPTKAGGKQANTVLHNILIKSMVLLEPGNPSAPELSSKEKMGMADSCESKQNDISTKIHPKGLSDSVGNQGSVPYQNVQLEKNVVSSCCLLARIMDTDARNQEQAAKRYRRFRKRHRHQERAQENSIER